MTRKRTVRRIVKETYCCLAPSSIHGIGVFAIRDIPKRTDPFEIDLRHPRGWVKITEKELNGAPAGVRSLLSLLFVPESDGKLYVPEIGTNLVEIGTYLNHSDTPNMRTKDGHTFIAKRKIREGEELTVDYATYGASGLLLNADRGTSHHGQKPVRELPRVKKGRKLGQLMRPS